MGTNSFHPAQAFLLTALALAFTSGVRSQDAYEIAVYGADTEPPRAVDLQLHSNYTFLGTETVLGETPPTDRSSRQTLEITYGFTPYFELGGYIFTRIPHDDGWQLTGGHIRPRLRLPAEWKWPVGLGLSAEIGPDRGASTTSWTLEIRPIIDCQIGDLYVAFNAASELILDGPGKGESPDLSPALKAAYQISHAVQAGVEYYGTLGSMNHLSASSDQQHQIFPCADLDLSSGWAVNLGVGFGFTPVTDHIVAKMMLTKRLGGPED